jgi:hypothetical protein
MLNVRNIQAAVTPVPPAFVAASNGMKFLRQSALAAVAFGEFLGGTIGPAPAHSSSN